MTVSSAEVEDPESDAVESSDVEPTVASPVEGENKSALDAVKAALAPKEESPTSEESGEETTESEPNEGEDGGEENAEDPLNLTEAEKKVLSDRAQTRFRTLASRAKDAETKVTDLSPKAENFDRIVTHLRTHGISDQEFNNSVEVMRLLKHDKVRAFEVIGSIYQDLAKQVGVAVPADLQEQVRLGYITEEHARKLAKAEAGRKLAEDREREGTERAEQENQRRAWDEQRNTATVAVDTWAKAKAGSDPDWNLKLPLMQTALKLRLTDGGVDNYPKDAAAAVKLAEEVLKDVETQLTPFKPKPKPKTPVHDESASSRNQAKPKSAVEAAQMALASMG